MFVNSTGLGTVTMVAQFGGIQTKEIQEIPGQAEAGGHSIVMMVESQVPVHWSIRITVGGADLRQLLKMILRFNVIWKGLKLLIGGNTLELPGN